MKTLTVNSAQEFEEVFSKALVDGAQLVSVQLAYPNNKARFNMKRFAIVAVLVAVLAVVGIGSVQAYNKYRDQRNVQAVAASVKAKTEAAKAWAAQQVHNAAIKSLENQCAKDHATYLAETPVQRAAKNSVADCNPSLTVVQ